MTAACNLIDFRTAISRWAKCCIQDNAVTLAQCLLTLSDGSFDCLIAVFAKQIEWVKVNAGKAGSRRMTDLAFSRRGYAARNNRNAVSFARKRKFFLRTNQSGFGPCSEKRIFNAGRTSNEPASIQTQTPELFTRLQLAFAAIDIKQQHAVGIFDNRIYAIICIGG